MCSSCIHSIVHFPWGLATVKMQILVQLTLPYQYSKEVLRSHTNFDVRICSLMFMQSTQICIITSFVVGFIGLCLPSAPPPLVIKINSQDILWNYYLLLNCCCLADYLSLSCGESVEMSLCCL